MKKVLCMLLALVLMLAMAVPASAGAKEDAQQILEELKATVSTDELWAAVMEVLEELGMGDFDPRDYKDIGICEVLKMLWQSIVDSFTAFWQTIIVEPIHGIFA